MLENLSLVAGVVLILSGVVLAYLGMQRVAEDANVMLIGGAVMFALGVIATASVVKSKRKFRRHYGKHRGSRLSRHPRPS